MPTSTSTYNNKPYYDDIHVKDANGLSPAEKFQRILFKPGVAVQARELTQIQSLLQQQISNIGDHFFKEGSLIVPGNITHNSTLDYIKVAHDDDKDDSFYTDLINHTIFEDDGTEIKSPIKASIKKVEKVEGIWVFYINYTSSNPDPARESSSFFVQGDTFKILDYVNNTDILTVDSNNIDLATGSALKAAATTISSGIFYINKLFVVVPEQTIMSVHTGVVDKNHLNFSVGLKITEEFVTAAVDHSLHDNSLGTNNTRAPGADRLHVKAALESTGIVDSSSDIIIPDSNYIELLRISKGTIIKKVDKTSYNLLADELARRTSDESGDYTIAPFTLDILDSVFTPEIDDVEYFPAVVGKSKAYVKGYEIETIAPTDIKIPVANKAVFTNKLINADNNFYIDVNSVNGMYDIGNPLVLHGFLPNSSNKTVLANFKISHIVPIDGPMFDAMVRIYIQYEMVLNNIQTSYLSATDRTVSQAFADGNLAFHASVNHIQLNSQLASRVYEIADHGVSKLSNTGINPATPNIGHASYNLIQELDAQLSWNTQTNLAGLPYRVPFVIESGGIFDASHLDSIVMKSVSLNPMIPHAAATQVESIGTSTSLVDGDCDDLSISIESADSTNKTVNVDIPDCHPWITGESGSVQLRLVIATKVNKTLGSFKTKTLKTDSHTINVTSEIPDSKLINLKSHAGTADVYDVYDILSISNSDDVEDNTSYLNSFTIKSTDNDNMYNKSALSFNGNMEALPENLTITYRYLEHSGSGDFFSIESYPTEIIGNLPTYWSSLKGRDLTVGNLIDFRTKMDDVDPILEHNTLIDIDTAIGYDRLDIVTVDINGMFNVISSTPSESPSVPDTPKNSLKLYELMIPANSWKASDITMKRINNRRYTMRDIGKIEKRVNRLEKYTTLSLLESNTMNIDIGRMKSGFFVDSFKDYSKADVNDVEFNSSVDPLENVLRATAVTKNFNLSWADSPGVIFQSNGIVEQELDGTLTSSLNIKKTGALVTLNYEEVPEIHIPMDATGSINVNPYMIPSYTGKLELSPASDDWKDTDRRPEVIFEQPGLYDAMLANIDMNDVGIFYKDWITLHSGTVIGDWDYSGKLSWKGRARENITSTFQRREGVENTLEETTELVDMGDRVVSVNLASSMRTRLISFKGVGLKPNTELAATFDDVDVSRFCRKDEVFIDHTIEGDYPNLQMEENYGTEWSEIEYLNVNHHPGEQSSLTTDEFGNICGSFWLPNLDEINFRTGDRIFRLTDGFLGSVPDSAVINREVETTTASFTYSAIGLIESKEHLTLSTRLPHINTHEISEERTRITSDVQYRDPLAQSFVLNRTEYPDGLFATSIDLYFKQKDLKRDVSIELREMRDGTPTIKVIPFSRVTLKSSEVTEIFKDIFSMDNVQDKSDLIANSRTKFKFESPVYLSPGVEYCWVLEAESDNYEVWYHTKGLRSLVTGQLTNTQLFPGTMFKSSNASTWSPDQESDIPFTLNRAKFNTNKKGIVNFKENMATDGWGKSSNALILKPNPFTVPAEQTYIGEWAEGIVYSKNNIVFQTLVDTGETKYYVSKVAYPDISANGNPSNSNSSFWRETHSAAANSDEITVDHKNHGFKVDESVTISGATEFSGYPEQSFNIEQTVFKIHSPDTYSILIPRSSRTLSGDSAAWVKTKGGGSSVSSTFSVDYSEFHLQVAEVIPNNTEINWSSNHTLRSNLGTPNRLSENLDVTSNITNYNDKQFTIASNDPNIQCEFIANLSSVSDHISPCIDLDRISVLAIENIIGSSDKDSIATYISKSITLSEPSSQLRLLADVLSPAGTNVKIFYKRDNAELTVPVAPSVSNAHDWIEFTSDGSSAIAIPIGNSNDFIEVELEHLTEGIAFSSYQIKIEMFSNNPAIVPLVSGLRVITGIS